MTDDVAFPRRMQIFRRDREMTASDHFLHNEKDWHSYIRADLADALFNAADAVLYHDERGQGVGYSEAMTALAKAVAKYARKE